MKKLTITSENYPQDVRIDADGFDLCKLGISSVQLNLSPDRMPDLTLGLDATRSAELTVGPCGLTVGTEEIPDEIARALYEGLVKRFGALDEIEATNPETDLGRLEKLLTDLGIGYAEDIVDPTVGNRTLTFGVPMRGEKHDGYPACERVIGYNGFHVHFHFNHRHEFNVVEVGE